MADELSIRMEAIAETAKDELADALNPDYALETLGPTCQSPIEKLLLHALCYVFHNRFLMHSGDFLGTSRYLTREPLERDEKFLGETTFLRTQEQLGIYRADFVVARWEHIMPEVLLKTPLIVVECDGHDYHERTKEQASHDKARDRFLQEQGHPVLRFTGSDIWADPWACAKQVDRFLQSRILYAYGGDDCVEMNLGVTGG